MVISSIIAAPTAKYAVSYDPETKSLIYDLAEIIGLVNLQDPDDPEEVQVLPCYMVASKYGFFWVPELEYNFLAYATKLEEIDVTNAWTKARMLEIDKDFKEITAATPETVEVETDARTPKVRRIKFVKKEKPDESST